MRALRRSMTNWNLVEGQWGSLTVKVKTRWGKLSAADIQAIGGNRPRLVAKLQENYNIFQLEAENQVNTWVTKLALVDPDAPPVAVVVPAVAPAVAAVAADGAAVVEPQAAASHGNGLAVVLPEASERAPAAAAPE